MLLSSVSTDTASTMALTFLSVSPFSAVPLSLYTRSLSLKPPFPQFKTFPFLSGLPTRTPRKPTAIGPDGKFYPTPSDDDLPEAPEDSMHGVSKFQQIHRQAARARKLEEEQFKKDQSIFLNAIADVEDAPDNVSSGNSDDSGDDLFGEIDKAIAMKRKEFVKQGLLKPNPKKKRRFPRKLPREPMNWILKKWLTWRKLTNFKGLL